MGKRKANWKRNKNQNALRRSRRHDVADMKTWARSKVNGQEIYRTWPR